MVTMCKEMVYGMNFLLVPQFHDDYREGFFDVAWIVHRMQKCPMISVMIYRRVVVMGPCSQSDDDHGEFFGLKTRGFLQQKMTEEDS